MSYNAVDNDDEVVIKCSVNGEDTASNHVIRNIYNTTIMSTKDSHFRRV